MDSNQEAKVSMYLKVQQFLTEKLAVLTLLFSIITDYKTDLDALISGIFEADALATADTTGYTEAKQTLRDEMTTLALRIGGGGASYYKLLGDSGSQNEIFFNPSEFTRAHDTTAYTMAMQVFRLANAAGAALAPHGITVGDITALNLKAQQYLAILELPKRKISAKGAQGKKVDVLMAETDDLLNETIDPQMRVLKGTANQELLDEYESNRLIDDAPTSSSGGGAAGQTIVAESVIPPGGIFNFDTSQLNATPDSSVRAEIDGGEMNIYAAELLDELPGATFWHLTDPTNVLKTLPEFAVLIGSSDTKKKVTFHNPGLTPTHYKLTFYNV